MSSQDFQEDSGTKTSVTPTPPLDPNDLSQEVKPTSNFYRGFFTARQMLPNLNESRQSTAGVILISALNCGLFYLIFRGRTAMSGGTSGAAGGGRKSIFRQAMEQSQKMMDPLAGKKFRVEHKGTSFKDVIGIPEALQDVRMYVDFLKDPDRFTRLGGRLPKGVLLSGPAGTGKTLMAKAVAGEANVPFFTASGADFIEVYAGSGPRRVRELFLEAREAAPSVVFIDEIDAIGSRGGSNRPSAGGVSGEENRTINQMLAELDGLGTTDDAVVVIAATNFADNIDKALTRAGRFDKTVEVELPDVVAREDLFVHYLKKVVTGDKLSMQEVKNQQTQNQQEVVKNLNSTPTPMDAANTEASALVKKMEEGDDEKEGEKNRKIAKELAGLTPGISPAAISTIVNEAALAAAIQGASQVEMKFLRDAIDDVLIGRKHRSRMTKEAAARVALHEAGHALVAWLLPQQRPVIKLSIIPRGNAGGFTQQLGREPGDHMTDTSLFSDICVMLGGRAAENTNHQNLSTGAQDDLRRATDVAIKQFLAFGMSHNTMLTFDFNRFESGRMYQKHSSALQTAAEKESKILVDEAMRCTNELLKENKEQLQQLTQELVEKTELLPQDLERILGKRPEKSGTWSADVHPLARAALDRFAKTVVSVAEDVKATVRKEAVSSLAAEEEAATKKETAEKKGGEKKKMPDLA